MDVDHYIKSNVSWMWDPEDRAFSSRSWRMRTLATSTICWPYSIRNLIKQKAEYKAAPDRYSKDIAPPFNFGYVLKARKMHRPPVVIEKEPIVHESIRWYCRLRILLPHRFSKYHRKNRICLI